MIIECRECGAKTEKKPHRSPVCDACYSKYQKSYKQKLGAEFKAMRAAYHKAQRQKPDWVAKEQKRGREYWAKLRHEAIMAYGGYRCACCGETEPMFLSIDHIFNDGAEHRRQMGFTTGNGKGGGSRTMKWLKDHGYPAGFQVLCMNCNHGKARYKGICPHKAKQPLENGVKTGEAQTG